MKTLLKGIIVGIGGIAPGLSGSVLLVILGLYQKALNAISTLFKNFKKNIAFLIPLIIGFGIGVLIFSKVVDFFLNNFEMQTRFTFLGLVLGTIPLFFKEVKRNGFSKKYYIFIDEVQKIDGFQKAVDSLYIKKNVDLYITGSNANLLSSELATLLSGRYIEVKMLPLSFKEYKEAYEDLNNEELYQKYISLGSLPYTTSLDTEDDVSMYLSSVYNDIIIKDVMTRKKIQDETMLRNVANFAMDNIGSLVSANNIANTMINDGKDINVRTVERYLEGFTESFFLYKASRYDIKGKEYLKTQGKYYVSDLGFRYFMLGRKIGDFGHILENVVYFELLRRGYDVYIGKIEEYEVDFVAINNEGRLYVQVTDTLKGIDENDTKILDRELRSLKKINDNYEKIILTSDKIPVSNEDGIKIKNVLEWLLDK